MDSTDPILRGIPLYRQILARLAAEIADGTWGPGDRLPTTLALARRFQVTTNTTQQALDELRQRGLIERIRGRGTFVSARAATRTLGVLLGRPLLADPDTRFYQLLLVHLHALAGARGWSVRLYGTPFDAIGQAQAITDLERDIQAGRTRALIALRVEDDVLLTWLRQACPLPWTTPGPYLDRAGLIELGLRHLAERGFASVAVLPGQDDPDGGNPERAGIARAVATAAGLPPPEILPAGSGERHGHAVMTALLARPPAARPRALLIGDDNSCRGAMYALLAAGLSTPRDLAVLTHANHGIEPFFPLPLSRIEVDPLAIAGCMLDELGGRIDGSTVPPPPCPPCRLVPGRTCGEESP